MSHFIVEYRYDGRYFMETLMGVEDIDLSDKRFENLLGIWECQTAEEVHVMHKHLREMRDARSS